MAIAEKVCYDVELDEASSLAKRHLVLHNDDFHTFEYVIRTLVEVCRHEADQAEQCAFIVHYKGRCDVKSGSYADLHPLKDSLAHRGLRVTID